MTAYYSGQLLTLPAFADGYRFSSTRYFTNKPPCGPKRGHGSVQPRFAFEVSLDKIAERLAIDPIELRRKNLRPATARSVTGLRVTSTGAAECLSRVEAARGWKERRKKLGYGKGLGVAASAYISGTNYCIYPNPMPQSAVQLKVDRSGVVTVFSGQSEIGQGCDLLLAVLVADELGLDLGAVRVVSGDTDLTPVDLGAYSSRGTFMNGNAALHAAQQVRRKMVDAVAEKLAVVPRDILVTRGALVVASDPTRGVTVTEAIQLAEGKFGTLGATGYYNTPELGGDYRGGTIGASPAYSFTAHVAEVEVDPDTGKVEVKTIWVAHDCGKAASARRSSRVNGGQRVHGRGRGAARGARHQRERPPHGAEPPRLQKSQYPASTCRICALLIVESIDPEGPLGAKEAGEGPLHPSIPAIANAIFDAVGVRVDRLPFTPSRVLALLREKRAREKRAAE